jgi:transposase
LQEKGPGVNVLKPNLRISVQTLLDAGKSQREISLVLGVDRKTIRRIEREAKSPGVATGIYAGKAAESADPEQNPPPRPPAPKPVATPSACEVHREWIESQVVLGRNAMSIYQDLSEKFGFAHRYNSVKRFVAALKAREPERFDVLDALPGEEAQVDFGQGALTRLPNGKYRRPYLFVMTLKYSGKSFRKVAGKADPESWARLHEEAFRTFGGSVAYVVLDNLKQGVLEPDLYAPLYNPLYAAMLAHYGAVADAARVVDPDRKGTVENAIQHTQSTALKGRKFDSIEDQNTWLAHWEERWAAPRIHGRKKRQVLAMFAEERPALKALPVTRFRYFRETSHTVDDSGLVQVLRSYYAAIPASPGDIVTVRLYEHDVEIMDAAGELLRRHPRSTKPGHFEIQDSDRIFNPSRETARLLGRVAKLGPNSLQLGRDIFLRLGRPGQKALYGMSNLPRRYAKDDIENAAKRVLTLSQPSYQGLKRILERNAVETERRAVMPELRQTGPHIRDIEEYHAFFENAQPHFDDQTSNTP